MSIEGTSALVSCRPVKRFLGRSHPALCHIQLPPPRDPPGRKFSPENIDFATQVYTHKLIGIFNAMAAKMRELNPAVNMEVVTRAFLFAARWHARGYRKSGLPFIVHPLEAAKIAVEMGCGDTAVVVALLLHDVLEETDCTQEEIRSAFGSEVSNMVNGLTRYREGMGKLEERASLEKTIEFSQEDLGVIFAKFCDRLHNMRTLGSMDPDKQIEIAQETMELYAPMANRLGFRALYRELQDLSLMYLHPEEFGRIQEGLAALEKDTLAKREEISRMLTDELNQETRNEDGSVNPPLDPASFQVVFTPRWPFEIFEQEEKRRVLEVRPSDVFSFLVLVRNAADTDKVIGRIHRLPGFAYVEHTYVDLIGHPSPNGYEAKHTAVMSAVGVVRIQTTTFAKHQKNEYGQVVEFRSNPAGWYKPEGTIMRDWLAHLKSKNIPFGKIRRALKASGKQITAYAVRPGLRTDEQPEAISLPHGATVLDLAYAVHEEIGLRAVSGMVNGQPAPLDQLIENGDRVSIYVSTDKIPNIEDLERVHTIPAAEKLIRFIEANIHQTSKTWLPAGRLRQALKPWFLDPYDFEEKEIQRLTRVWLTAIESKFQGLKNEAAEKITVQDILDRFTPEQKDKYKYNAAAGTLVVKGKMSEAEKSALLALCPSEGDQTAIEKLFRKSQSLEDQKEGEAEEGVMVRLLRWISLEELSASEAVAVFQDIFDKNRVRMQSIDPNEQKRICRFRIDADQLPDTPGVLAAITTAIANLGLNIRKSTLKENSLSLEVEITWPLHEIQIERIILDKAPGSHIVKKFLAGRPAGAGKPKRKT